MNLLQAFPEGRFDKNIPTGQFVEHRDRKTL